MRRRSLGIISCLTWFALIPVPGLAVAVSESPAGSAGVLPASELLAAISAGRPPDLSGVTIEGTLDLRPLEEVRRPFRCRSCRFTGDLLATDVIFERIVDLSDSTFEGRTDLTAAVFRDRTGFEGARFAAEAGFGSARFAGDTYFAGARFAAAAAFDRAQFAGGTTSFSRVRFTGDAVFSGAQFSGAADFSGSEFSGGSGFQAAGFGKRVSFARARFARLANWHGASLAGGAHLGVGKFDAGFDLEGASAAGTVEFTGAVLEGDGLLLNFSSSGTLSLEDLLAVGEASLFLDRISVERLTMDPAEIGVVRGPFVQKRVLRLVEKSGRESGDLALANRARFQLLDLEGSEKRGFDRLVDRLFFRDVAGYLVRPLNPLLVLALAVVVAGGLRAARPLRTTAAVWHAESRSQSASPLQRLRRAAVAAGGAVEKLLDGISTSVRIAVSRKADHIKRDDSDRIRDHLRVWALWGEFLGYKALIAVFLLSLGNSNSTIRQLLDAVVG